MIFNKNKFNFLKNIIILNIVFSSYVFASDQFEIAYRTPPSETMATGTLRYNSKNNQQSNTSTSKKNSDGTAKQEFYEDTYYDSIPDDEPINLEDVLEQSTKIDKNQRYSGHFKIGNPYKISGISYTPQNYQSFEEEGTASWYGSEFHGKKTANGEIYNMGDITAAHPTLPLPSLIKVTNLKNNKTLVVRVNDRGPFAKNRIIDVSEKTAEILGFKGQGTTKVKIEFLRKETDEMLSKLGIANKKNEIIDDKIDEIESDNELEIYVE